MVECKVTNIIRFPRSRSSTDTKQAPVIDHTPVPDIPGFPDIINSVYFSGRSARIEMTIVGIDKRVRISIRDMRSAANFLRAIYRQTGVQLPKIPEYVWKQDWLRLHMERSEQRQKSKKKTARTGSNDPSGNSK